MASLSAQIHEITYTTTFTNVLVNVEINMN